MNDFDELKKVLNELVNTNEKTAKSNESIIEMIEEKRKQSFLCNCYDRIAFLSRVQRFYYFYFYFNGNCVITLLYSKFYPIQDLSKTSVSRYRNLFQKDC